jgi:hypothetical protein
MTLSRERPWSIPLTKNGFRARVGFIPKTEGDAFASPLIFDVKSSYFFLALFFFAFFLVAMFLFSLSIFHGCGSLKKTAIDECIELLKIEVKKKIDVILDCRLTVADEF